MIRIKDFKFYKKFMVSLKVYILVFFLLFASILYSSIVLASNLVDSGNLSDSIKKKNVELNYIKKQIQETQNKLVNTQTTKQTLSYQLRKINYAINQIDLSMQSSKIAIEKSNLEIESLRKDMAQAKELSDVKQAAVYDILRKIQERGDDNILYIIIKDKAFSDSIFEIQALKNIYSNLILKINELDIAREKLNTILNKKEDFKKQKVVEVSNLSNKKIISQNIKSEKVKIINITKNKEKNYEKYITDLRKRQAYVLQEVFNMEAKLTSSINYKNLPKKLPGLLEEPVKGKYVITQGYGVTPYSRKLYRSGFHNGVDVGAPIGTPIVAAQSGIVVAVGNQDKYCWHGAYGKFVVIKHYIGLTTLYGHMSLHIVKAGQVVKKGQIIGYVGRTGFATGPHLHFTVYDSSTFRMGKSHTCGPMPYGGHINPNNYVIF